MSQTTNNTASESASAHQTLSDRVCEQNGRDTGYRPEREEKKMDTKAMERVQQAIKATPAGGLPIQCGSSFHISEGKRFSESVFLNRKSGTWTAGCYLVALTVQGARIYKGSWSMLEGEPGDHYQVRPVQSVRDFVKKMQQVGAEFYFVAFCRDEGDENWARVGEVRV